MHIGKCIVLWGFPINYNTHILYTTFFSLNKPSWYFACQNLWICLLNFNHCMVFHCCVKGIAYDKSFFEAINKTVRVKSLVNLFVYVPLCICTCVQNFSESSTNVHFLKLYIFKCAFFKNWACQVGMQHNYTISDPNRLWESPFPHILTNTGYDQYLCLFLIRNNHFFLSHLQYF